MKKANILKSSEFYMAAGDKLSMLFIDEQGTPVTITVNSVSDSGDNIESVPDAPIALPASDITVSSFTANWNFMENTLGFYLDVAEDSAFTSMVAGYDNLDVGLVNEYSVVGLDDAITYYYRLRGYNDYGTGVDSNIITTTTDIENVVDGDGNTYTYVTIGSQQWLVENLHTTKYIDGTAIPNVVSSISDWFLPSKDELNEMYNNLHLFGVGGFNDGGGSYSDSIYMSSSEALPVPAGLIWIQSFDDGTQYNNSFKNEDRHIRPCRSFVAGVGAYSLRDSGPSGGLIFYIDGGTTYYEAAPYDIPNNDWSNITGLEVGTGTAIGNGQANTTAIIGQVGHIFSAAKDCNDFVLTSDNFWINDTTGAYCAYDNDPANATIYGYLYNWYAVDNAHGLAPTGWRVPDDDNDWDTLITFLGGASVAGGKLKEMGLSHWANPNLGGTDDYGFKGLPAGYRDETGTFNSIGSDAVFTTTDDPDVEALNYNAITISSMGGNNKWGVSVRCMRDI